jgi:gamma-glutamyl hercynylcysteine S-oxide synthase
MGSPAIADRNASALAAGLHEARQRTLTLVADLNDEQLEKVHSTLMSPLVWDLGHIAAFEDLWIAHRLGGLPLLRDDLMDVYDAFETPRAHRGNLPFLRPREAREFLDAVRERTLTLLTPSSLELDPLTYELVIRHELQHEETMMQTMALAQIPAGGITRPPSPHGLGLQTVTVPAGTHVVGAPPEGFAYDNERPQWQVELPAFEIGEVPVTNGEYREFVASGDHERPGGWTVDLQQEWRIDALYELDPDAPVVHVSWDQATAFAQAHDARLPTEFEWEAARPRLQGTGHVWEWTSSHFNGYPGFAAHPYREYSEVFFGDSYRVLRGSSWATDSRVATPSFRNWDYPERRQIFNGFRIARDK